MEHPENRENIEYTYPDSYRGTKFEFKTKYRPLSIKHKCFIEKQLQTKKTFYVFS